MLGLFYLLLAVFIGYSLLQVTLPKLSQIASLKSLYGKPFDLNPWMIKLPASFLTGTLILTWFTYISACIFSRFVSKPLLWANIATFIFFLVIALIMVFVKREKYIEKVKSFKLQQLTEFYKNNRLELYFILAILVFWSFFVIRSFFIKDGSINIGISVFSDFGPHLSMIRSFSLGSNFPTEYPHFADGTIRYHFLFLFLSGNLEFLGLRLDWAFNLPSILSMMAFLMLLYSLAVILTGKKSVGLIAVILFFFRSSFAFFTYLLDMKGESFTHIFTALIINNSHIGKTLHEEWGLWTQKVYVNQRHLPFAMGVLIFVLIIEYPLFKKMIVKLKNLKKEFNGNEHIKQWFQAFLYTKDAWLPANLLRSVMLGLVLGLLGFWNGAVVVATLLVLFFLAVLSKHRLEYLVTAVIALALTLVQSNFFTGGSAVDPKITIGFLAPAADLASIIKYYIELLGFLPFVAAASLFILPKGSRWLVLVFFAPVVLATTVQLTPDVTVNHKFIILSVTLLNIFIACYLHTIFHSKRFYSLIIIMLIFFSAVFFGFTPNAITEYKYALMLAIVLLSSLVYFLYAVKNLQKILAVACSLLLVLMLTITGFADLITQYNMDRNPIRIKYNDPVLVWTANNTQPRDIFLTPPYSTHPILLAGRNLYYGWPYYAWSAGYDTNLRKNITREIYECADLQRTRKLIEENKISYIVIDNDARNSKEFNLNEGQIRENFVQVYADAANKFFIYKTGIK